MDWYLLQQGKKANLKIDRQTEEVKNRVHQILISCLLMRLIISHHNLDPKLHIPPCRQAHTHANKGPFPTM